MVPQTESEMPHIHKLMSCCHKGSDVEDWYEKMDNKAGKKDNCGLFSGLLPYKYDSAVVYVQVCTCFRR